MEKQNKNRVVGEECSSSWVRGKCVGRGCFGTVSTAVNISNGHVFAVKSVDLATCLPSQAESLENEIQTLRTLKPHPHVVEFLGDDVSSEGAVLYRNLHMEYLPHGTVADVAADGVDESLIRRYTWCLVSALRHVHSNGIVHCDVKGRNVLLGTGRSSVKIGDFGSAMEVKFKPGGSTGKIWPRGSPLWMAPEVIRREYQGPESDVWSLGCTIIEMVTGKPAWEDRGFGTLSRIGYSDELPWVPSRLSELGRDFLDKCLRKDPSQRWSCDQLLQHPFLSLDHYSFSTEASPRCVLDRVNSDFEEEESESGAESGLEFEISSKDRICKLAVNEGANWESDGWVDVRVCALEAGAESKEYSNMTVAGLEAAGKSLVVSDLEWVKWEFPGLGGFDPLEWQMCNFTDHGTATGFWFGAGSSCRHGKLKVGSALEEQHVSSFNLFYPFLFVETIKIYFVVVLIIVHINCYNILNYLPLVLGLQIFPFDSDQSFYVWLSG